MIDRIYSVGPAFQRPIGGRGPEESAETFEIPVTVIETSSPRKSIKSRYTSYFQGISGMSTGVKKVEQEMPFGFGRDVPCRWT